MITNNLLKLENRIKQIKLIVMDFDGVFTDGGIYLNKDELSFRKFDVKDGIGIKLLQKVSINLGIVSGSNSEIINIRSKQLGINNIEKGVENKQLAIRKIQQNLGLDKSSTLFLGDDINDLTVIPEINLFFVPSDGHNACKQKADFIGQQKGGNGFIREIADSILFIKGFNPFEPIYSKNEFSN